MSRREDVRDAMLTAVPSLRAARATKLGDGK
jgi:hypothetical protein